MKRKMFGGAVFALAFVASPAWAIVADYTAGATTLKANQDGFDFEIRDEVSAPGGSIRVYFSPSTINGSVNCVTVTTTPIKGNAYIPSSVTGVSNFVSPTDGFTKTVDAEPVLHDNPTCYTDKFGYFTVDTVIEGTAQYRVLGLLKSYIVEVTFGPNPSNSSQTVVRRLRTNSY
ncbi:MAG: hypothetical protein RL671_1940 [Pseudomonadota bacterium]|jgi:hypothetical protein